MQPPEDRPGDPFADMRAFDYQPITRVIFSAGAIAQLGDLTLQLAESCGIDSSQARVLIVSDPGIVSAGHAQRGIVSLNASGLKTYLFDGVAENPTTRHVEAGVLFAREKRVNLIVGLGGGSSMDCAKGINFILSNGGRMADYWGVGKAARPMLPLIAIPTTAGTGSEAQSFALIADEKTHQKMACGDKKAAARIAVLDPQLTVTQPRGVTAATGLDAVAHAIESYVCTTANPFSRLFAERAWELMRASFEAVISRPGDVEARGRMLLGAHLAGLSIENSMLGAAHAAANPLTALHNVTHGIAVAVMLPHVIRFNESSPARSGYNQLLGKASDPVRAGAELSGEIERMIATSGLPSRLRDAGVPAGSTDELSEMALKQWTASFNPRPLTRTDFANLYEQAW